MNELPKWVGIGTPIIAVLGLLLGIFNSWYAIRRRRDDLFELRYAFYQRVRAMCLSTGNGAPPGKQPWLDIEDLISIAEEAEFLFGKDISKHICSLEDKQHSGSPFFPNDDFVAPFKNTYPSVGGCSGSHQLPSARCGAVARNTHQWRPATRCPSPDSA